MDGLLTLREVAERLNVTEQRVYQLDSVLCPVLQARGTKMKARYYQPEVVERVRSERAERANRIAALKEKTVKSGFYLTVDGEVHIEIERLWPNGAPENPTVGDVVELLSGHGLMEILEAFGLMEELVLVVKGNGGTRTVGS